MKPWLIAVLAVIAVPLVIYAGLFVARWFFLSVTADQTHVLPF